MRIQYRRQLETLHLQLVEMGSAGVDAIETAIQAVFYHDVSLMRKAIRIESEMDEAQREIQSLCMRLLLGQQPVAGDLRRVSATMHMIADLERIGDLAEDIAEVSPYVKDTDLLNRVHIREMSQKACRMVSDSLNSYINQDVKLAKAVVSRDDEVDAALDFAKKNWAALITEVGPEKIGESAEEFADILMISKYLERVADHATNIAEWVIYAVDGILPGDQTEASKWTKAK